VAYRADIEIAVRGAQELKRLQNEIKSSADAVNSLNSSLNAVANLLPRSFNNLNKVVGEAAANFNAVALGTKEASEAARDYYQANKTLNNALRERIKLLNDIQTAERGTVLANIKASQASRAASGFGAFSASIDIPTQKSIRRNQEKRAVVEAAAETANQIQKLADRQEEFTTRTNAGAQAAARQTAEFYRLARIAKEVAKINAAAGPAQLLLAPAALGAPAMGGGARRRITGPVERLGSRSATGRFARTADEAAMALRFAQATDALVQSTSKIDLQYNRFLPSSELLNAANRGIQQLTTNQDAFNQSVASGTRFQEKYNQELERRRRLGIGIPSGAMPGVTGRTAGPFPVEGPIPANQVGLGRQRADLATGLRGRLPGAVGGGIIGAAFPLLFGQGAGAATGGGIGGLLGGLTGVPGGSFAGSLLGTLLGDVAESGTKVKALAEDMGLAKGETEQLAAAFRAAGADAEKFGDAVQYIRGIGFTDPEQVEAIKLVSKLTEDYGGKIDKVTTAYANFAARGKVGISDINKFTAQNIPVLDELEKKFGVNRDAVLKLAKSGKISAQELSDALIAVANKSKEAADKTNNPWQSAWQKIVGGTQITVNAVGIIFGRLLSPIADVASSIATAFGNAFDFIVRDAVQTAAEIAGALASAANNLQYLTKLKLFGDIKGGAKGAQQDLLNLLKNPPTTTPVGPINIPGQLPAAGGGADKAARDAAREAERVLEVLRDQRLITIELENQSAYSQRIFAAEMARDPMLVRRLQGEQQLEEIAIETAGKLEKEVNMKAKLAILQTQETKAGLAYQKTQQDLAKLEKERKDRYDDIVLDLDLELKLRTATTEEARQQLRIENEIQKLKKAGFTPDQIADITQKKQQLAAPLTPQETIAQRAGVLSDELTKLISLGTQATQVAESIGTSFANSFKGVISGTMTAQEALASFFQSVADRFLDMAAQIIAKMIEIQILNAALRIFPGFGGGMGLSGAVSAAGGLSSSVGFGAGTSTGFGFRAAGGPVSAGSPYMVGERGPELFVPGRSGTIVPNNSLSSDNVNVVVNVDASGSTVQGDGGQAGLLGRVVAAAVQQELIRQKRPGGILS